MSSKANVYTVDVFAEGNDSRFPENSYYASTPDEVKEILENCSRPIAGIDRIEVQINEKRFKAQQVTRMEFISGS